MIALRRWLPVAGAAVAMAYTAAGAAPVPMQVETGPRGEVRRVSVGGIPFLEDLAVAIVRPRWQGNLLDQRTSRVSDLAARRAGGRDVLAATLHGDGVDAAFRETVRRTASRITVEITLTPRRDVDAETVLLQGTLPAPVHAGATRWAMAASPAETGVCPAEPPAATHVIAQASGPEWVAFLRPGGPALLIEPGGAAVQFQDNRRWEQPTFALQIARAGGRLRAGVPVRFAVTLQACAADSVKARIAAAERDNLARVPITDNRPLRIAAVRLDRARVRVFGSVEVAADVRGTYRSAFDPAQVSVDAEVLRPDGRSVVVPGFYGVPVRREPAPGAERLAAAGPPGFRVRYTPVIAGTHRIVIRATDRSGTVRSRPLLLRADAGNHPGFVRVARADPRYFALDSGQPYFAVGENLCWANGPVPVDTYEAWLRGLGRAGGNWARLWLACNEKGLEWMPRPTEKAGVGAYQGLGAYAQDNAWRLDRIVEAAEKYGVRLMLCLGTYGEFTEGGYFGEGMWVSNPYNARNGGPCATPADFWTNPEARRLYRQRLRYLVARWGHAPAVYAWEFWNEVPPTPQQNAWVAEMAAELRRIDPNHRPVSTTYGDAATWRCPDIAFTMTHMYGQGGNVPDFTPQIQAEARKARPYRKPYLLAEFGIDWQTDDGRWDPRGTGLNMHNGAWAAMMSGAAGSAMLWYWDGYVHPRSLYRVLAPVRRFADRVPWGRVPLEPVAGIRTSLTSTAPETFAAITVPGTLDWGRTPAHEFRVLHDGSVEGGPVPMTIGSPVRGRRGELHETLTWRLDLVRDARVVLRLGQVCQKARLVVRVDGRPVVDRALAAGAPGAGPWKAAHYLSEYRVWISDYDEDIVVDVPAGSHAVQVANLEGDWLQIRSITIPAYRSSRVPWVDVLAMGGRGIALLWVHDRDSTWRAEYRGEAPGAVRGLHLTVPVTAPGDWTVEWWDTFAGRVLRCDTVRAAAGALSLSPPAFTRDVAARCRPGRP